MSEKEDKVIHVLLLEDNPDDVLLLREALLKVPAPKFELICTERLAKALKILHDQRVDIVLSDLNLPDSRGLETLHSLAPHARGIPIIVLTGFGDEEFAAKVLESGARDCLVKGKTSGQALANAMQRAIEQFLTV